MRALRTSTILAGTLVLGALTAAPAMATSVTWNLGTDSYTGVSGTQICNPCTEDHSINYGQASFNSDSGGVPLILSAFATTQDQYGYYHNNGFTVATGGGSYGDGGTELTRKEQGGSENGVGATYEGFGNTDGEIETNEAVLVDASQALAKGYSLNSLSIGSVQQNEGFTIYQLTTAAKNSFVSAMNGHASNSGILPISGSTPAGWTQVASFANYNGCQTNTTNCAVENVNVNVGNLANPYLLITDAALNCNGDGDILLSSVGGTYHNSQNPPPSVPEPASLALLGVGLAGLGFVRRQRRTPA